MVERSSVIAILAQRIASMANFGISEWAIHTPLHLENSLVRMNQRLDCGCVVSSIEQVALGM